MTIQFTRDEAPLPRVRHTAVTTPQDEPDLRWLPESFEERQVIAHTRGWAHLAISCQICRVEAAHAADRATLHSIITGER